MIGWEWTRIYHLHARDNCTPNISGEPDILRWKGSILIWSRFRVRNINRAILLFFMNKLPFNTYKFRLQCCGSVPFWYGSDLKSRKYQLFYFFFSIKIYFFKKWSVFFIYGVNIFEKKVWYSYDFSWFWWKFPWDFANRIRIRLNKMKRIQRIWIRNIEFSNWWYWSILS